MSNKQVLFVSHGGGPMPLLGDPGHQQLVDRLKEISGEIKRPDAILVISAHWEESVATVTTGANPELIYDYYGFPPESYQIKYPAPGQPQLAQQVVNALKGAGVPVQASSRRGFDHGMFVPLKLMYPQADIPVVQLSLVKGLNPDLHLKIGKALQAIDFDNLLVFGSGFSFHNMRAFFAPNTADIRARNLAFEEWLLETCSSETLSASQRSERFSQWEQAPYARFCHPREEHLMPLHVCYGVAEKVTDKHWNAEVLNKQSGLFYWAV